jgi:CRISPR-associated protein Csm5
MSARFMESWGLFASTLGPVHMGTGDEYGPTEYVIDGDTLYAFDAAGAARALPQSDRDRLLNIVSGQPASDMLKQVQKLFLENREYFVPVATHAVPIASGVSALYEARAGRTAQREESGREIINKLGIARTYTNPLVHQPALLGSGIKGAIRTALLNACNDGRSLTQEEQRMLEDGRARVAAGAHRRMQERLFEYRSGAFDLDPMRLVQVGDLAYQENASLPGTEVHFAVNRKRHAVMLEGQEVASLAEKGNLYQILETIPPMRYRAFAGWINLQKLDEGLPQTQGLPATKLRWSMEEIAGACNRFYEPKLREELDALKGRGFLEEDWVMAMDALMEAGLRERLRAGGAFLLRVGRHSGAEAVTLDGVRYIKIMRGRGQEAEYAGGAKTWWLSTAETGDRRSLLPFGWILLELAAYKGEPPKWSAAERAMEGYAERYRGWQGQLDDRKEAAEAKRASALERQRRQEEESRARIEAERDREKRFATMTEEQRAVAELSEWLEEDRHSGRKEAGGRLSNRLIELLKKAQDEWEGLICVELADLAEEIYGFLGWPGNKKKKQERRALVRALRDKGV